MHRENCESLEDAAPRDDAGDGFAFALADRPVLRRDLEVTAGDGGLGLLAGPTLSVPLNETATEILLRCQGTNSVRQIIEDFQNLFVAATAEEIERGVLEFLEVAHRRGWVDRADRC